MTTRNRLAAVGAVVVVVVGSTAAVALSPENEVNGQAVEPASAAQPLGGQPEAAPASTVATREVLAYFAQLRQGLAPLLLYVRQLPLAIESVAGGSTPTPSLVREARRWAESFATARDLVGRLVVPAPAPPEAQELMQLACQLYRQSALTLIDLDGVPAGEQARGLARRADVLHQLGDRLIDQVRRLLEVDKAGTGDVQMELRYAPPVPGVQDVTGQPAPPAGSTTTSSDLTEARTLLDGLTSHTKPSDALGTRASLRKIAASLERSAEAAAEDVISARMALALGLLATEAMQHGPAEVAPLLTLTHSVWSLSGQLSTTPRPELSALRAPELPRSALWKGGAFDGNPPPLEPGDDVGAGLSGGLPGIDPAKILKD